MATRFSISRLTPAQGRNHDHAFTEPNLIDGVHAQARDVVSRRSGQPAPARRGYTGLKMSSGDAAPDADLTVGRAQTRFHAGDEPMVDTTGSNVGRGKRVGLVLVPRTDFVILVAEGGAAVLRPAPPAPER